MNKSAKWELNPIIVKELRSRMRGARAFAILTGSLVLMGGFGYALYRMTLAASQYTSSPISPQVGQMLFTGLAFMELMIIAAITPSITAGEISGEKEKQTYEMLLITPLSPSKILWGKLVASMSYVFLLVFAALPMASLMFIFGGVALRDMLKTLVVLFVVAVMFGVIGLFMSALFGRSGRATVVAYLTIALLLFGPLFIAILVGVMKQSDPPYWIMMASPITVLASAFAPSVNVQNISSTFWMLGSPVYWLLGGAPISLTSIPRPAYHIGLPIYGLITLLLYQIAARLVKPIQRWRIHWSESALAFIIFCSYASVIALGYLATTNRYENIRIVTPQNSPPGVLIETPGPVMAPELSPNLQTPPMSYPPIETTPGITPESPYPAPKGAGNPVGEFGLE
jgi:ABC-type transport system involved in multi-copper enzyme maturation permease subunit